MHRKCELCETACVGVPLLTCGNFICPTCYVKLKSIDAKCKCPLCRKNLKRRVRM